MTKKKSFLFVLLLLTICLVLTPMSAQAKSKIKLNKKNVTINVGQKSKLKVKGAKAKKWVSTNKNVATVKKGVVTAVNPGTTTVKATVKVNGRKKVLKCKVTVKNPTSSTPTAPASTTPTSGDSGSGSGNVNPTTNDVDWRTQVENSAEYKKLSGYIDTLQNKINRLSPSDVQTGGIEAAQKALRDMEETLASHNLSLIRLEIECYEDMNGYESYLSPPHETGYFYYPTASRKCLGYVNAWRKNNKYEVYEDDYEWDDTAALYCKVQAFYHLKACVEKLKQTGVFHSKMIVSHGALVNAASVIGRDDDMDSAAYGCITLCFDSGSHVGRYMAKSLTQTPYLHYGCAVVGYVTETGSVITAFYDYGGAHVSETITASRFSKLCYGTNAEMDKYAGTTYFTTHDGNVDLNSQEVKNFLSELKIGD